MRNPYQNVVKPHIHYNWIISIIIWLNVVDVQSSNESKLRSITHSLTSFYQYIVILIGGWNMLYAYCIATTLAR